MSEPREQRRYDGPGDPRARYLRDPEFKMLVDLIYSWIHKCQYTPSEVREAAMLAALRHEQDDVRPILRVL